MSDERFECLSAGERHAADDVRDRDRDMRGAGANCGSAPSSSARAGRSQTRGACRGRGSRLRAPPGRRAHVMPLGLVVHRPGGPPVKRRFTGRAQATTPQAGDTPRSRPDTASAPADDSVPNASNMAHSPQRLRYCPGIGSLVVLLSGRVRLLSTFRSHFGPSGPATVTRCREPSTDASTTRVIYAIFIGFDNRIFIKSCSLS